MRADAPYGQRYTSRTLRMATTDFSMEKKNSELFSSLINLSPFSAEAPLLSLNSLISNIPKVYARKFGKETAVSPHRWRNHCLRSNVYGNTHCIEIEDAMSDPARNRSGFAPGYASNFRRCRAHSREKNTDKIRNRVYSGISIANPF